MAQHLNGVWLWELSKIRSDYLDKLVERKVKRVYLKVFDGKSRPMFWERQCSTEIIEQFQSRGIEVYGWGYHYGTDDIFEQVSAVEEALDCGLDGYVLDLEKEVEDKNTHIDVDKLLFELRPLVKEGTLGYTSFGHPGLHLNIPWQILDNYCDVALPQIYFEKFTFKSTTPEKIKDCLDAHKLLGLKKPILPIWGSESDTLKPATAAELQEYLNNAPGSSIWRIPKSGERGEAWNVIYSDFELPILRRNLRQGRTGEDVKGLQKVLNARGFNAGTADGNYGSKTEVAVKAFQKEAGMTIDGEVGKQTWTALGGKFDNNGSDPVAKLVKFGELPATEQKKLEVGFDFPLDYGSRYAKQATSSTPNRWLGEPGQRARYIKDDDMPIVADPQHRSAEQIRQVIDYFNVTDSNNGRYAPGGGQTFCNIFVRDVMRCLRAPLTHWVGEKEQEANDMHDWLSNSANGWSKVSADEATEAAVKGIPALACWKNVGGIGHIAVVRPEPGEPNNPRIAQAGGKNFANGLMSSGFRTDIHPERRVNYFVYFLA